MNPLETYQAALDAVSASILANDFAAYIARIDLPYLLCTLQESFVLHRPEELEPTFRNLAGALQRRGVTDYIRIAHQAELVRPDRIEGWHNTNIIVGDQRVVALWATRQAIVLRDGVWRFSEGHYPFFADSLPLTEQDFLNALRPSPPPLPGMASFRTGPSR
jgi:hypothetical protein